MRHATGSNAAEVAAVDFDCSAIGVVEPAQQFDQGGLAGAVESDHGQALSRRDVEVQVRQHRAIGTRIREADPAQPDVSEQWTERGLAP